MALLNNTQVNDVERAWYFFKDNVWTEQCSKKLLFCKPFPARKDVFSTETESTYLDVFVVEQVQMHSAVIGTSSD